MKSNTLLSLTLVLPLALFAACSSDDDTTNDNGGTGGSHAGRAGSASGGRAGAGGHGGTTGGKGGGTSSAGALGVAGEGGSGEIAGAGGDASEEAGAGGAGGEGGAVAALNDAQILKVLSTANEGEVSVAQVAKPALQNSAAVSFAQMMIDEHGAANGLTLALVSAKHLAPEPSEVSESLEADVAAVISTLSKTASSAFDKVYINGQVTMHQQVLGVIDGRLVPDARDPNVKALLATLRTSVAAHLTAAQTISATLP